MGTEIEEEYAHTGLHAYALIQHVSADPQHPERNVRAFVMELQEQAQPHGQGPVTSVVEIAGTFKVLVHLRFEDDDLNGLQSYLATEVWNGVEYELVLDGPAYTGPLNELIPFKRKLCTIVAVVKVWAEKGRAREVLGRLGDELGAAFHGASIVYGSFDILLALNGDDVKSVAGAALSKLQQIPGVARTETSFTDWRRTPWHPEHEGSS